LSRRPTLVQSNHLTPRSQGDRFAPEAFTRRLAGPVTASDHEQLR
jgi:hypothetical protein